MKKVLLFVLVLAIAIYCAGCRGSGKGSPRADSLDSILSADSLGHEESVFRKGCKKTEIEDMVTYSKDVEVLGENARLSYDFYKGEIKNGSAALSIIKPNDSNRVREIFAVLYDRFSQKYGGPTLSTTDDEAKKINLYQLGEEIYNILLADNDETIYSFEWKSFGEHTTYTLSDYGQYFAANMRIITAEEEKTDSQIAEGFKKIIEGVGSNIANQ